MKTLWQRITFEHVLDLLTLVMAVALIIYGLPIVAAVLGRE